jgi:hypothetical protein
MQTAYLVLALASRYQHDKRLKFLNTCVVTCTTIVYPYFVNRRYISSFPAEQSASTMSCDAQQQTLSLCRQSSLG